MAGTAPSGWKTPKTNWASADVILPEDMNRIEGNINAIEQGSRTIDPSQAPTGVAGNLRNFLDWFANRIKAILGTTNWYDAPPTTLKAAKTHIDAAAPHSGHATTAALTAHTSAAAPHSGHETPAGAQAKADGAEARAKAYTDQEVAEVSQALDAHKAAAAPHSGHETPAGAQAKAEAAAGAVQAKLDAHLSEDASKDNVHGLRNSTLALGVSSIASGQDAIAIGNNASSKDSFAIAIGRNSSVAEFIAGVSNGRLGIAIGTNAKVNHYAGIAIGDSTYAGAPTCSAIGYQAEVSDGEGQGQLALGRGAVSSNPNTAVLGGDGSLDTRFWQVPGSFTVHGVKNFEIPHPKPEKKATHRIRHGAVESPTPGDTLYRWRIQATKDNDLVTIDLPDYFVWLNKDVQIFVTPQGHFGNGYGTLNREAEQLEIHCQFAGEYNVLVIGTRNDDHPSVQEWYIKGVEREIGESWTGETYVFSVDEIIEIEEIKEVEVA